MKLGKLRFDFFEGVFLAASSAFTVAFFAFFGKVIALSAVASVAAFLFLVFAMDFFGLV